MNKRFGFFGSGLLILLLLILGFRTFNTQADTSSGWLNNQLNIQSQNTVSALPASLNGNVDCSQAANGTCIVPTSYGSATSGSEASLNGSSDYYPVLSYLDNHQHFIPIPNSNTVITYTTEPPYGFYLYFNHNFSTSITALHLSSSQEYQLNRPPDAVLADRDGHKLAADYTSFSFSADGRWMVISEPNVAMLRVNLDTFEVTPFAPGFNYTISLNPALQTAISDDGRYAVVASKAFGRAAIYDLDTCTAVPSTITGPADCQSRDLEAPLSQQISGFISASNIRFIDGDDLSLYGAYGQPASPTVARYIVSDAGGLNQVQYLALGDSYISGEGAFDYQTGTDTDDNRCHVSTISYPYLLGYDLSFDSYHSVACSGATTDDIINLSSDYSGQASPHLSRQNLNKSDEVPSILANFSPGYIDQLDFVTTYQPQTVTLSIGGNDMGFSDIVKSCVESVSDCYSTYEDRQELVNLINNQVFPKLVNTYQTIEAAGPPDMRLYAIGYPQIAKPGGDCALNVHLDSQEVLFSQQLISYLDSIIQQAANRAGAYYVDTQDALDGHRLCEAELGSVAINGLTAGNDRPSVLSGPLGDESYHPNALGHELLENAILAKTQKLTAPMPAANPTAKPPASAGELLNVPHSGRALKVTEYDSGISGDVLLKQSLNSVTIYGPGHSLGESVTLNAEIHSDPVSLGSYTTDADGNLSAQIVIPDDVGAGYHTLHFYGTDLNGQPIDIYKIVYVAGSPDDIDGDNIPDSQEPCVGIVASNQDNDQDGIDDACDATIGIPPAAAAKSSLNNPTANAITNTPTNVFPKAAGVQVANPRVLAAQTAAAAQAPPAAKPDQLTVIGATQKPNPRVLLAAGGACVWITICYAAWKFRG